MNKLFPFIILAMIVLCTFLGFKACKQVDVPKTDTLYTVITKLKAIPYHDTIRQIKTTYRLRIDTALRYIQDSTLWLDVCRIAGIKENESQCKRILVRGYLQGLRDSQLLSVYQRQRTTDSTIITHYETLDAINRAKLDVCMTEQQKTVKAVKKEVNRKRIFKAIAATFITLFLVK
jgi:hypothetical protein